MMEMLSHKMPLRHILTEIFADLQLILEPEAQPQEEEPMDEAGEDGEIVPNQTKRKRKSKRKASKSSESSSDSESSTSEESSADEASTAGHTSTSFMIVSGMGKRVGVIDSILGSGSSRSIAKAKKGKKSNTSYPCSSIQTKAKGKISSYKLDPPPRRGHRAVGSQQERGDFVIQTKIWNIKDFSKLDAQSRWKASFQNMTCVTNQGTKLYNCYVALAKELVAIMKTKKVEEKRFQER